MADRITKRLEDKLVVQNISQFVKKKTLKDFEKQMITDNVAKSSKCQSVLSMYMKSPSCDLEFATKLIEICKRDNFDFSKTLTELLKMKNTPEKVTRCNWWIEHDLPVDRYIFEDYIQFGKKPFSSNDMRILRHVVE